MINRLSSICPYFAMFPDEFARDQIRRFSKKGEVVFDCFSGRGTSVLQSLLLGRKGIALDINPVAYCISAAKASTPTLQTILRRIAALEKQYLKSNQKTLEQARSTLPPFFRRCFYHSTLQELIFLRKHLRWRTVSSDRFIATLVLGSLHGEMDKSAAYFSNQMPRTISTKPDYSIRYWSEHDLWPLKKHVFRMLRTKASFRLSTGKPNSMGEVALSDARRSSKVFSSYKRKVSLLLTSPPYLDVTNYEEDQWLRLWFLGFPARPTYGTISRDDRHADESRYWAFLREVWQSVHPLMRKGSRFVCRIGAKGIKEQQLIEGFVTSVKAVFHEARLVRKPKISRIRNRQTDHFQPGTKGCLYEMDFVFRLSPRQMKKQQ